MTPISRAICLVVAAGCGYVLVGTPSEVDQLAIGMALGRPVALALLAIATASSALAACGHWPRVQVRALLVAAATLWAYGVLAVLIKGGIALPTAALAVAVALRYGELAGELRNRQEDRVTQ